MVLSTLVPRYRELAGGYGRPVHLSNFGLSKPEIEMTFSEWDEDYQISRYMMLSRESDEALAQFPHDERVYLISGFECSHVTFAEDIQKLL